MPVENDIFISYAHLDNESPIEGRGGWVTTFHRALEVRVGQLLGRKPRIFRDLKLDRAKPFPEELEQRLSTTTLLVCILSPGYVESAWCRRELTAFLRHESAVEAGRVFKVAKTHLKIDDHPEALREVLGHDFFVKDDEVVRDLDQTFSTKELQDKYWVMLDDLARAITRRLKELKTSTNEPRLPEPSSMANRLEIELKIKRPFDQFSKEN